MSIGNAGISLVPADAFTRAGIRNVKDFGAVGDGSTDDTATFAAFAKAVGSDGTGIIPAGTYSLTSLPTLAATAQYVFDPGAILLLNGVPQQPLNYYHPEGEPYNVQRETFAAGSSTTTTGSMTSGSKDLTGIGSTTGWSVGMGISVAGAGTSGALLVSQVVAINGTTFTLADAAGTTVADATVSHNDHSAMTAMISAAITMKLPCYIPPGTYNFDDLTLSFPHTMPAGFAFRCEPEALFNYSGSGDAVNIDSNYLARFEFGQIQGTGETGSVGIHVQPANVGPNGQTVMVVSQLRAQAVQGFITPIYFDCNTGDIAQTNVRILVAKPGAGTPPGTIKTNCQTFLVDGVSPQIFQGNRIECNYPAVGAGALASGIIWKGIISGSTNFGEGLNNVNTWVFGGLDGESYNTSYGIEEYGGENLFVGPIVDIAGGVGVLLQSGASKAMVISGSEITYTDNSGNTNNILLRGNSPVWSGFNLGTSGHLSVFNTGDIFAILRNTAGIVLEILNTANTGPAITFANSGVMDLHIAPTSTASPSAGGAGALPATPAGYVTIQIGGVDHSLPYY